MKRWHGSDCHRPDIVVEDVDIRCRTCYNSVQPDQLTPPFVYCTTTAPPEDEPLGLLNLSWPPCVPYTSLGTNISQPDVTGGSSEPANQSQELPHHPTTIYDTRLLQNEFRLLILDPSLNELDGAPVHVDLQICAHNNCPEYETVSYTWGGEEGDSRAAKPIFVGSYWDILFQTKNCWEMLRALRRRTCPRVLWVDAICINQRDIIEREAQVNKMGRIYEEALRVVVHLGEDLVSAVPPGAYPNRLGLHELQNSAVPGLGLNDILKRKYFRRVWVIQELMLSKQAVFRIGAIEFWANHITRKCLQSVDPGWDWSKSGAPWLQHTSSKWIPSTRKTALYDMLLLAHACESADIRDKLFAILGVVEDHNLYADYSISAKHLFIGTFAHILLNLGDTRVLSRAAGLGFIGYAPTWLPKWSPIEALHTIEGDSISYREWALDWQLADFRYFAELHKTGPASSYWFLGDEESISWTSSKSKWEVRYAELSFSTEPQGGGTHGSSMWGDLLACGTTESAEARLAEWQQTPWNSHSSVDCTTGSLSLTLIHVIRIDSQPIRVGSAHGFNVINIGPICLVSSRAALDTIRPGDHLFLLPQPGPAATYFVLRRADTHQNFHLVCSIDRVYYRVDGPVGVGPAPIIAGFQHYKLTRKILPDPPYRIILRHTAVARWGIYRHNTDYPRTHAVDRGIDTSRKILDSAFPAANTTWKDLFRVFQSLLEDHQVAPGSRPGMTFLDAYVAVQEKHGLRTTVRKIGHDFVRLDLTVTPSDWSNDDMFLRLIGRVWPEWRFPGDGVQYYDSMVPLPDTAHEFLRKTVILSTDGENLRRALREGGGHLLDALQGIGVPNCLPTDNREELFMAYGALNWELNAYPGPRQKSTAWDWLFKKLLYMGIDGGHYRVNIL